MMSSKTLLALPAIVLGLSLLNGCEKPRPKLVPVTGIVTIDDEPAAELQVRFLPDVMTEDTIAPTSFGTTDENGEFTLMTYENEEGAMLGPHKVIVSDPNEERAEQGSDETVAPPRVATKYGSAATTIIVQVEEGKRVEVQLESAE
jgi:hypothetical protein